VLKTNSVLSSALETEHFDSLSVYYEEVLQIRAPSLTTENILQFIRQIVQCDI